MIQIDRSPKLFLNKIDTLLYLKNKLTASYILDLYSFSIAEYRKKPDIIYKKISSMFYEEIIIRSSASTEDQYSTNAGHFFSSQHINSQNKKSVYNGIESVISSYEKDGLSDSELIFVQKQLTNVILSGVALSFEPKYGKPYFVINFDDSGSTDSVTSGKCQQNMYIARDFVSQLNIVEAKLCAALLEVEQCCNDSNLNVEFAITEDGKIYIFQVRRLKTIAFSNYHAKILELKNIYRMKYSLKNILLSDMAFWNPSEIIGDNPHPLDYSLYSCLVTNSAWNQGIAEIGYFSISKELMVKIGNKPYINLETAFFALTPSCLSDELRKKLVNFYYHVLLKNKNLHDKIEFKIVHTCFDFSTFEKLSLLSNFGFTNEEIVLISTALFQITKSIIEQYDLILNNDLKKIDFLESELNKCKKQTNLNSTDSILASIKTLIPIIRYFGVIPFARHARCAFIAHSICLSLVETEQITSRQLDIFMHSINTVANELRTDVLRYKKAKISKDEMIYKYGHLRSNTYDISSPTYKEMDFDVIFDLDNLYLNEINELEASNLCINFPNTKINIVPFVRTAIAQREYFKFSFTKALSYLLELISKFAQKFSLSNEEISFLPIEDILNISLSANTKQDLVMTIHKNKQIFELNSCIILPSIVSESKDFDVIRITESIPNFITNKTIIGEVYVLDKLIDKKTNVSGKIVVLQNADPGFDWIFAQGSIIGLVTKYGGMASHMAIRCMEFGIPAAIGCGELIYNYVVKAKRVKLDCSDKIVIAV